MSAAGPSRRSLPTPGPRVGIWGTFDVANFGDLLFPRIFERELRRRLPEATVHPFSPRGRLHPVSLDGGSMAEPLGEPTPTRLVELARELDFVAIGGGDIIHSCDDLYAAWYELEPDQADLLRPSMFFVDGLGGELEAAIPVAWHSVGVPFDLGGEFAERVRRACARRPYVSVRDDPSRARLYEAGVERDVILAPDSAFVLDRLFPLEIIAQRRAGLAAIGAYPPAAAPLVIQGGASLGGFVDGIGRVLGDVLSNGSRPPVLLIETGPCHRDREFADAIAGYLDGCELYRLPSKFTLEDIVTAIAQSCGFVGSSLHGSITAYVYGRPFLILDLLEQSKLSALATITGATSLVRTVSDLGPSLRRVLERGGRASAPRTHLSRLVDSHFDRLAELAESTVSTRPD